MFIIEDNLKSKFNSIPPDIMYKLYNKLSNLGNRFEQEEDNRDYIERAYNIVVGTHIMIDSVKNSRNYTLEKVKGIVNGILYKTKEILVDYGDDFATGDFNLIDLMQSGSISKYKLNSTEDDMFSVTSILLYILVIIEGDYNTIRLEDLEQYEKFAELKEIATLSVEELESINSYLNGADKKIEGIKCVERLLEYDVYCNTDFNEMYRKVNLVTCINGLEEAYHNGLLEEGVEDSRGVLVRKALIVTFKHLNITRS